MRNRRAPKTPADVLRKIRKRNNRQAKHGQGYLIPPAFLDELIILAEAMEEGPQMLRHRTEETS